MNLLLKIDCLCVTITFLFCYKQNFCFVSAAPAPEPEAPQDPIGLFMQRPVDGEVTVGQYPGLHWLYRGLG